MAATHEEIDPLILRYIVEDGSRVNNEDPLGLAGRLPDEKGWLTRGRLPDGRSWGVQPIMFGGARLHVWRPGMTLEGVSDSTWDYAHPVLATLADQSKRIRRKNCLVSMSVSAM